MCKGKRTGGGGAQRYVIGKFMRGKRIPNKQARIQMMTDENAEYARIRRLGLDAWEEAKGIGAAGTISHQAGGSAFGYASSSQRASALQGVPANLRAVANGKSVADAISEFSAATAAEAERTQRLGQQVGAWSQQDALRVASRMAFLPKPHAGTGLVCFQSLPCGSAATPITFLQWTPPGTDIARRALSQQLGRQEGLSISQHGVRL